MKKKKNNNIAIGQGLAMMIQMAINVVIPMFMCIYGAGFLVRRFGLGKWVIVVGLLLGILIGLYSAYGMIKGYMKLGSKERHNNSSSSRDSQSLESENNQDE